MKRLSLLTLLLTLTAASLAPGRSGQDRESFSKWVDAAGTIRLPEGFRADWSHLGAWVVPEMGSGLSFHEVYTERSSAEHFRKHGTFPDGATLVKEIRNSKSAKMTTGQASWADQPQIWFVMVKDTQGRFPGNPTWGDGWGWALFKAEDTTASVTKDYYKECIPCHIPAKEDDWVYIQGYPTLRARSSRETASEPPSDDHGKDSTAAENTVVIKGLAFGPDSIRVKVGTTLTWTNQDGFPHTATADDGSFDTGLIQPGESASATFEKAGAFPYHCTPHPFMKAAVEVVE